MPGLPDDYTSIMLDARSRDVAREVKDDRGDTWSEFLEAAAEELSDD